MRMLLGIVGLLVTVAIVGLVAKAQLRPLAAPSPGQASESASASAAATPSTRDLPRKVQDDLTRAIQQAPARDDESR
ncbi:MAG: hypothetical protein QFE16_11775 [Pseudomonadota bacterium]|nr:hypothetical protein [Pseudomonadota bacterium]